MTSLTEKLSGLSFKNKVAPQRRVIWLALTVLVSWLALSTLAMYYFVFADYGEFDPEQQWLGWNPPANLGTQLELSSNAAQWSIVHVQDAECSCNSYLQSHLRDITNAHPKVTQLNISVENLQGYGFVVPAAPMALIFQGQQLIYAGPYASGPFCATENSLISDLLSQRTQLAGTYLQGLVKACRCLT